jgi:hypothetical protein
VARRALERVITRRDVRVNETHKLPTQCIHRAGHAALNANTELELLDLLTEYKYAKLPVNVAQPKSRLNNLSSVLGTVTRSPPRMYVLLSASICLARRTDT